LSGGAKLTRDYANKLGKPLLHMHNAPKERIFNADSHRLEIQALNFLCSNEIEILNVAGPRESKELGLYERPPAINRTASGAGSTETAAE
jgi:hypothetical protein